MNYKQLQAATIANSLEYVKAFCEIMHYSDGDYLPDICFVGGDPFGVVLINDDYWNMTDLYYVISEYDKWVSMYGKKLRSEIKEWYWYSISTYADKKPINLLHWLMGARLTDKETSQEYKDYRAKIIKAFHQRVEENRADLERLCQEELNKQSK